MTLRSKFIAGLIGMVIFMAFIFAEIFQLTLYTYSKHAEEAFQEGIIEQWERILTAYFIEHDTWEGVGEHIAHAYDSPRGGRLPAPRELQNLYVFDREKKVVSAPPDSPFGGNLQDFPEAWLTGGTVHPIQVDNVVVGYFGLDNHTSPRSDTLASRGITQPLLRAALAGVAVTSILALLFGIFFTRRLTGPLRNLTGAVQKVGEGDYTPLLEVKGKDDIALLSRAFNGMLEKLVRNEEVRRNMVADVAHELRTPLAVISGKLESIQQGVIDATPENLLPIQDETIRLIRLVRELQQLNLAEAGKLPLSLQRVKIRDLVEKIIDQFAIEFETRQIEAKIEGEIGEVSIDPDRMTQVFVNLIGNALRHTPLGGRITISFSESHGHELNKDSKGEGSGLWASLAGKGKFNRGDRPPWIKIDIQDTGEGIPEEELPYIFDRFYRIDRARNRESGHTGLGLAIAKEFAHAHGGLIRVESKLGAGTCFTLFLPRRTANSSDLLT